MEKKRNIQVGNFFWFGEEIVQVYDKCAWELLPDNEHKNRYSVVNKEGELFGCNEENLKDIILSVEMLETFFTQIKNTDHECVTEYSSTEYIVTNTISRFQFKWNYACICAEMFSVCGDKRWWIGRIEYVHQLQNILNDFREIERIHYLNENGEEIPFEIDTKVKQFLWRD